MAITRQTHFVCQWIYLVQSSLRVFECVCAYVVYLNGPSHLTKLKVVVWMPSLNCDTIKFTFYFSQNKSFLIFTQKNIFTLSRFMLIQHARDSICCIRLNCRYIRFPRNMFPFLFSCVHSNENSFLVWLHDAKKWTAFNRHNYHLTRHKFSRATHRTIYVWRTTDLNTGFFQFRIALCLFLSLSHATSSKKQCQY